MWQGEEVIINNISLRRIKKGIYLTPSKSTNEMYEIDVINQTHPDCLGFQHRGTCRHWEACIKDYDNITKKEVI